MEDRDPAEKDKERESRDVSVGNVNEKTGRNSIKTVAF